MGSPGLTPPEEATSPADSLRKRVCKACDRCRLKKSKCDGSNPCSRCKADNAICVFGERKKSHDKVYPKGYVEMLEHQQSQLVFGLQELYRRLRDGEDWDGPLLKESAHGMPLTHDILDHLGALKHDSHRSSETFEDDLPTLQRKLIDSGVGPMKREMSFDTTSEPDQSPLFEAPMYQKPPHFTNPWPANHFPPTPPLNSPRPSLVKTSSPLKSQMNTTTPQFTNTQYVADPLDMSTSLDFSMTYDTNSEYCMPLSQQSAQIYYDNCAHHALAINPTLTMKQDWQMQDEQLHHYFQGGAFT